MEFLKKYEHHENYNIKKYNTYRLEVITKYLVFVKTIDELIELLKYLRKENIKHIILGNGSNVIFKDNYFDGVIIKLDKLNKLIIKEQEIEVEAGFSLMKLSREILEYGLSGLEFAAGIPGLVGSSIAMNAGAYNKDMASIVKEVKVINENNELITMTNEELQFEYRDSFLKKNKNYICVSAVLTLEKENKEEMLELINIRRERRMETQPLEYPSAGSVFRNPEGMHAGALIENCGLKGYNINDAEVSIKHANFIINKGNCTGKDIIELINLIKEKVLEKYNVELILEQEII